MTANPKREIKGNPKGRKSSKEDFFLFLFFDNHGFKKSAIHDDLHETLTENFNYPAFDLGFLS
jgi:hypothetical protein